MLYFYLITTIILKKTKSILREKINKKLRKNTTEIYHGKEQFN